MLNYTFRWCKYLGSSAKAYWHHWTMGCLKLFCRVQVMEM